MVALLLHCYKIKQIDRTIADKTFSQINDYYTSLDNSHSRLCLIFLKYCKENNVLSIILQQMIGLLIDASYDKYEFLNKIRFFDLVFRDLYMWKVFETSVEHLSKQDHYSYKLFLLNLKLYLEELEESKSRKFHEYEITRLEKSKDLDTVVLEGYCSYCKDCCIKSMKTMKYLEDYVKAYVSGRHISYILCTTCNQQYLHFEQVVDSSSILNYFDNTVLNGNEPIEKELLKRILDFNKEENVYTEKSQQFQWIIHFLNNDDNYHNITDTQDWVLLKAPRLFDININDKPSIQKKDTNALFNRHLDKLEKWNIFEFEPSKGSKKVDTRRFRLSLFGKIVAAIVETVLYDDKKDSCDKLFEQWKSHLNTYPSSLNLFCLKYLDKCKEEGLFEEFVNFYIQSFSTKTNQYIQNVNDLFTQMIFIKFDDNKKNSLLFNNLKSSFDELDEKTKILFSNYVRLYINRLILREVKDYHEYELKRFDVRDKTDIVIAETRCPICQRFQYISVNVISYLSYLFDQPDENMKGSLTALHCKYCGVKIVHIDDNITSNEKLKSHLPSPF